MNEALLPARSIRLAAAFSSKEEAIRACGKLLLDAGCIEAPYIDAMVERDEASTVYVGNGVAVPHGTKASIAFVKKTGLALIQVPAGIDFGKGRIAKLLIAVAAKGDEHMDLLSEIAELCVNDEELAKILNASFPSDVLATIFKKKA